MRYLVINRCGGTPSASARFQMAARRSRVTRAETAFVGGPGGLPMGRPVLVVDLRLRVFVGIVVGGRGKGEMEPDYQGNLRAVSRISVHSPESCRESIAGDQSSPSRSFWRYASCEIMSAK